MNRFTWDMRYPNAHDFPGLIMWAGSTRGPLAPPGRYQIKLTAAGVEKTQDFLINRNAAVPTVTDADLVEQFKLAKAINDKVTAANDAVIRIRNLKTQSPIGRQELEPDKSAGRIARRQADGYRGRDLSVSKSQQPGPAELPDQAEQQAGGTAGDRRIRRLQAHRSVVRGFQGPFRAARQTTGEARCAHQGGAARAEQIPDRTAARSGQGRDQEVERD